MAKINKNLIKKVKKPKQKPKQVSLPQEIKKQFLGEVEIFLEKELKPHYNKLIKTSNDIEKGYDFGCKMIGNRIYFFCTNQEINVELYNFARIEYLAEDHFQLCFIIHNDWYVLENAISLSSAFNKLIDRFESSF